MLHALMIRFTGFGLDEVPDLGFNETATVQEARRALKEARYISAMHDAVDHNDVDLNMAFPPGVADSRSWSHVLVKLQYGHYAWSYHSVVVRALMGNEEIDRYQGT